MTRSALPAPEDRRGPPDMRGQRLLGFTGQSYDEASRTIQAVLSVGTRVKRWFGFEQLSMDPASIDLSRVQLGQVRFLDSHNAYEIDAVLGVVTAAAVDGGGSLNGSIRLAETPRGEQAAGMISRGEVTGLSIGYQVKTWRLVEVDAADNEVWEAAQWELLEVSLVSVPADPAAGVRTAVPLPGAAQEDADMNRTMPGGGAPAPQAAPNPVAVQTAVSEIRAAPATAPAADPAPAAAPALSAPAAERMTAIEALDFAADASSLGVEAAAARAMVETMTPPDARAALLRAAADRQRATAPPPTIRGPIQISRDERDTARAAMAEALLHRHSDANQLTDLGREYRGLTLLEMVRMNLERNGHRTAGMGKREVADMALRAQSTSDFPNVITNVANRTLRNSYEGTASTFKPWMRKVSAPDFKPISRVQLGGAPSFLQVPEGGEFKMGAIGDGREVYSLATYGRRFVITRQTIINDDLDAFSRIPGLFGRAAADFESDAAYAPLLANPNMADGNALFSAAHGNVAGAGAPISETTVIEAETGMSNQVGIEGRLIGVQPAWLITGVKNKVPAQKLVTGVQATATGNVNVYANAFSVVSEARLNARAGPERWFMAADYNQVDTFEYAYLDGDDGVFLEERLGYEVDGLEYKARLDFGVKAIDWRGLWMNPGT
ncbi:MAG: HK97 family phage prohead protease [Caulobacteraceae bacterium]|nr:HK97 family phage prohead protease [Caulobacteraceae bacterium]